MGIISRQLAAQLAVHTMLAQQPVVGPPQPVVCVAHELTRARCLHAAPAPPGPLAGRSHAARRATFRAVGRAPPSAPPSRSAQRRLEDRRTTASYPVRRRFQPPGLRPKRKVPTHREIRRCMQHGKNHAQCRLSLPQWNAGGTRRRPTQLLSTAAPSTRCFSKRPVIAYRDHHASCLTHAPTAHRPRPYFL